MSKSPRKGTWFGTRVRRASENNEFVNEKIMSKKKRFGGGPKEAENMGHTSGKRSAGGRQKGRKTGNFGEETKSVNHDEVTRKTCGIGKSKFPRMSNNEKMMSKK